MWNEKWVTFIPAVGDLYLHVSNCTGRGSEHQWWLLISCSHHVVCDWSSQPDKRRADYDFIVFQRGRMRPVGEQLRNLRGFLSSGSLQLVCRGVSDATT